MLLWIFRLFLALMNIGPSLSDHLIYELGLAIRLLVKLPLFALLIEISYEFTENFQHIFEIVEKRKRCHCLKSGCPCFWFSQKKNDYVIFHLKFCCWSRIEILMKIFANVRREGCVSTFFRFIAAKSLIPVSISKKIYRKLCIHRILC